MSKSLPLLCVALLTSSLIAQTIPQGFANKEGGRSRHVPLMYQPARIQCAYDAFGTGWLAPKVITSLWVRHDTTAPQSLQAAFKTDLQVWLSSDGVDTRLSSNMFIPNHGKDMVLFMKRKTYNFAPFAASPLKPAKFNIELKGDRPFVAVKRTFLVDWAAYSPSWQTAGFFIDATTPQSSGGQGSFVSRGTACNPTNFSLTTTAANVNVGQAFTQTGNTQNKGDIVLEWIGAAPVSIAMGGGCSLYTLPVILSPVPFVTTTSNGAFNFAWGNIPASLRGLKLYLQAAAITSANALRFSNGLDITFGITGINNHGTWHRYGYGQTFNPDTGIIAYGWQGTGIIFDVR